MGTGGPRGTVWAQEPATTQGTTGTQRTDPPGWPAKKRFFLRPTLDLPVSEVRTSLVTVEDSIPNDTLFQLLSSEGFPVASYRKINTDVCFDGKCRMLKVSLRSEEQTSELHSLMRNSDAV